MAVRMTQFVVGWKDSSTGMTKRCCSGFFAGTSRSFGRDSGSGSAIAGSGSDEAGSDAGSNSTFCSSSPSDASL